MIRPWCRNWSAWREALPRLDFGLLQPRGWWARTTGKGRSAGAEFAAQFEQIDAGGPRAWPPRPRPLQRKQQEQATAVDLALLELEVEYHAIDKIIDQGARWLQDMRNQLKARQAAAGRRRGQEQIREDAARCEILVARLKVLRAVSSGGPAGAPAGARRGGPARGAAASCCSRLLASDVKAWQAQLVGAGRGAPATAVQPH